MEITCKRCGFRAEEEFFYVTSVFDKHTNQKYRRRICCICQQENRDKYKETHRLKDKVRNSIYHHARKENIDPQGFIEKYGWNINALSYKMANEFEHTCPDCHRPYNQPEKGLGLNNLTFDIINPEDEPYLTNVRFLCKTCNGSKGRLPSDVYSRRLIDIRRREDFLKTKPKQLTFQFN